MENERVSSKRFFIACLQRALLSKKYTVHLAITFITAMFSIQLLKAIYQTTNLMPSEVFETFKSGNTYNIGVLSINRLDAFNDSNSNEILKGILSGSFLICIIAAFVSMFICSEFKNSYIKIAITHGQTRLALYNQYILISVIVSIPISIVGILGVLLSLAINRILVVDQVSDILSTILFQIIMIMICSICFACISILLEKHKAIAVCVSSVFLIPLLPGYMQILTKGRMNIEPYTLFSILIHSSNYNNVELLNGTIVAAITASILYFMSLFIFHKRNIE